MSQNSLSVSKVFLQTISFFFDPQKIKFLFTVPAAVLLLLSVYEHFDPFLTYAETADLQIVFNPRTTSVFFIVVPFLITGVTRQSMDLVFFGQGEKTYFIPRIDKPYFRFMLSLLITFAVSLMLSALVSFILITVIEKLSGEMPFTPVLKALMVLALVPYFMIRTGFSLAGSVIGEKIGVFQSWSVTGRLGMGYSLLYLTLFVVPVLLGLALIRLYPDSRLFVGFVLCFSLTVSGALQGVFMAKLFSDAQ